MVRSNVSWWVEECWRSVGVKMNMKNLVPGNEEKRDETRLKSLLMWKIVKSSLIIWDIFSSRRVFFYRYFSFLFLFFYSQSLQQHICKRVTLGLKGLVGKVESDWGKLGLDCHKEKALNKKGIIKGYSFYAI